MGEQRSRMRSRARRIAVAGVALALLALLCAAGAQALVVRLPSGRTLSYLPLRGHEPLRPIDEYFSNVDYDGGPVMPSNTNYTVYWDPPGGASFPPEYAPGVDRYFTDLAHDSGSQQNVDSVAAQYNDAAGHFAAYESRFGGALVDSDPYPASGCTAAAICLTDKQIRAELVSFLSARGLPEDLTHEYFLLTPPGVESCFEAASRACSAGSAQPFFCAYHGNTAAGEGELIYANDPYVSGNPLCDDGNHPNGSSSDGALEGGLSHEHDESITDPEPNSAWTDVGGSGGEIGDKCAEELGAPLGTAPNGAAYNQVLNGDRYWYQEEWSNQGAECLPRLAFAGARPTATFTAVKEAGDTVAFDASASSAPGGVARYSWQWNDEPGVHDHTETRSARVSHTFPEGGIYNVALTVYAADGTSIGTAQGVAAGVVPPPSVTKVAPRKGPPAGGTQVTITGTALTGATAVTFGSTPAASFAVSSDTSIVATTPAASAGTVDVRVTTPAGTSAAILGDHFKFGPPTVTSVSPGEGPTSGGTTVAVTGTGFVPGVEEMVVKFGASPASGVVCASSTVCTAIAPAHRAGTIEVRAAVAGMVSPREPPQDYFSYR